MNLPKSVKTSYVHEGTQGAMLKRNDKQPTQPDVPEPKMFEDLLKGRWAWSIKGGKAAGNYKSFVQLDQVWHKPDEKH